MSHRLSPARRRRRTRGPRPGRSPLCARRRPRPGRRCPSALRPSDLAAKCGLSLSRISRIIDALEDRKLVERCAVAQDARAREAWLTDSGLELVQRAQASHFAAVQRLFFEQLNDEEIATLAAVFSRFAPRSAEACTATGE